MGHLHLSINITSLHATAILHQGLGELHHPLHHSPLHCSCIFFFFYSLLSGSLALSLTRCECIDSQSTLTKWKQAAHLCPRQAKRAYNQNNIKWLKKERDGDLPYQWNRWEIMQLGGVPKTQTWMQRGKLTRQRFAFPRNNINVNAHFLSKKWKFNKATLCLCLWLQTSPNTELWSKTVSECTQLKRSNQFNITLSFKLKLRISAANEFLFELVNQG